MNLNPETLHGTHYTEEQFDKELERRLTAQIDKEGDDFDESNLLSWKRHFLQQLYHEWNPGTSLDDFIQFENTNSLKYNGFASMGYAKESNDNPLLVPIHGISLKDYAAIAANLASFEEDKLFAAFGIDKAIFDELNTLWPKRMQEDETFTLVTLYGQYFTEINDHPTIVKLRNENTSSTAGDGKNLEKLRSDRHFYEELNAARSAAYEYGIDGAQWIEDNFGIGLMDFQAVAMEWMTAQNQNFDTNEIMHFQRYYDEKYQEYKARFAAELGGDVADDITF